MMNSTPLFPPGPPPALLFPRLFSRQTTLPFTPFNSPFHSVAMPSTPPPGPEINSRRFEILYFTTDQAQDKLQCTVEPVSMESVGFAMTGSVRARATASTEKLPVWSHYNAQRPNPPQLLARALVLPSQCGKQNCSTCRCRQVEQPNGAAS